jgi:uncharacterized protein YjbI with pentapeptide repeats
MHPDLSGANLSAAELPDVDLSKADLTGVVGLNLNGS